MPKVQPGWHDAPPDAGFWHCPECETNSAAASWPASADTRTCPNPQCEWAYTPETARRISQADTEGLMPRDDETQRAVPPKLRPQS